MYTQVVIVIPQDIVYRAEVLAQGSKSGVKHRWLIS